MEPRPNSAPRGIPRAVWALGFVSLLMDVSSEMIHALLPVFLVSTLGASAALLGVIEGLAEGTASVVKLFSGAWSDRSGRRKRLALIGYGIGALTKPVFALAASPLAVLAARFVDRIGKGIRGAPRDALVADSTPAPQRGAAFGLRQALDTVGACAGPLLASVLLGAFGGNIRSVFGAAIVPGGLSVLLLALGVEEPEARSAALEAPRRFRAAELRSLGAAFWGVVAIGALFTLARFSEAFLVLRAQDAGAPIALVPGVLIAMNLVYALTSTPAGRLSDRIDRRRVLAAGLVALIAADLALATAGSFAAVLAGAACWGLHLGLSQGLFAALVADTAPESLRGTAFGIFHLASGAALFAASLLAGLLWEHQGPAATFLAGAAFAALALLALLLQLRRGTWRIRSGSG